VPRRETAHFLAVQLKQSHVKGKLAPAAKLIVQLKNNYPKPKYLQAHFLKDTNAMINYSHYQVLLPQTVDPAKLA
jgi:hypothetical protein